MVKDHVKAVLERVATWPEERQELLAELAVEIEAEMLEHPHQPSADELKAIDEGLEGKAASKEEVEAAFAALRRG